MQPGGREGSELFLFGHVGPTLATAEVVIGRKVQLSRADLVWLSLGALLPDLVDKPLSVLVFRPDVTRSVGHTLVFSACLLLAWLVFRRRSLGLLWAAGVGHLVLDEMWTLPQVLLWPLMGFSFPALSHPPFFVYVAQPGVWGSELAGLVLLALTCLLRARR